MLARCREAKKKSERNDKQTNAARKREQDDVKGVVEV